MLETVRAWQAVAASESGGKRKMAVAVAAFANRHLRSAFTSWGDRVARSKEVKAILSAAIGSLAHRLVSLVIAVYMISLARAKNFETTVIDTVDCPQSSISQIEQFLKVAGFCGDGRGVIQLKDFPGTEQVQNDGFSRIRRVFALRNADCI
jgi:hypothetical protein